MKNSQKFFAVLSKILGVAIGLILISVGFMVMGTLVMIIGIALPEMLGYQKNCTDFNFNKMSDEVKCRKETTIKEIYKYVCSIETGFGKPWIAQSVKNLKSDAIIFGVVNNTYIYLYLTADKQHIKIAQGTDPTLIKPYLKDQIKLKNGEADEVFQEKYITSSVNINIPNTINYITEMLKTHF